MKQNLLLTIPAAAMLLASCDNSKFEGYKMADNGLHYKFYVQSDTSRTPAEGDGIAFRYVIKKYSNDSTLVDSKAVSRDGTGITKFLLPKSSFRGSIEDALMMMHAGDSASFIISADSFFLKTNKMNALPPYIKPGENLAVFVKMATITTRKEIEEQQKVAQAEMQKDMQKRQLDETPLMMKYLTENKINVKPTKSGLIYIETKKGSGPKPKDGDEVSVNYIGTFLDGQPFDQSRGEPIKVGIGTGLVIPGWDEALQLMNKGAVAKLIIPSNLAYGPQGNQGIPPYATLVFTVEVVDIKEAAAK